MTQAARLLAARMAALNFTLEHGSAISDDAFTVSELLGEVLLRFEEQALPTWDTYGHRDRFLLAFDTARCVLAELLPGLNRSLEDHDRFEWRIRLCRLLMQYMGEQDVPGLKSGFSAMTDYYCLVWDALFSCLHYQNSLLTKPHYDEFDGPGADLHFTCLPN